MDIIKDIGKILKTIYPTITVYDDKITQGVTIPSFYVDYISHRDISVSGIKFNKVYSIDVIYRSNSKNGSYNFCENLKNEIDKRLIEYKILSYEIEFVDNEMHLLLELMKKNYKKVTEIDDNSIYGKLRTGIERITGKKCYYITTDLQEASLTDGFYLIKPDSLDVDTISLNHKKEKERVINLIYFEDSARNYIESLKEVEEKAQSLAEDMEFRKNYINMNYSISVNYESDDEYFTDLIYFTINLVIKER